MKAVFLDLDGTLLDSKAGITNSVRSAFERLGMPIAESVDLDWVIGPPLLKAFARLGAPDPAAALEVYRKFYGSGGMFEARLYPGIPQALQKMQDAGLSLFLATSKATFFATEITERFGLKRYFTDEFGSEMDGTRTEKADLLAHALKKLGISPGNAVMVGDRDMDIDGAHANRMASVWCGWGFGPDEGEAATARATTPDDMAETVIAMLA